MTLATPVSSRSGVPGAKGTPLHLKLAISVYPNFCGVRDAGAFVNVTSLLRALCFRPLLVFIKGLMTLSLVPSSVSTSYLLCLYF